MENTGGIQVILKLSWMDNKADTLNSAEVMWMGQPTEGRQLQNKKKWPLLSATTTVQKNVKNLAVVHN